MLVSLDWIKDYVDLKGIDEKEFCDKMIMSGSNVETCEKNWSRYKWCCNR